MSYGAPANFASEAVTEAAKKTAEKGLLAQGAEKLFGGMSSQASEGTAKVLAGVGQGAFQAAGSYLTEGEKADKERELMEFRLATEKADRASNMPAAFAQKVANITTPDWWSKHLDPTQAFLGVANA
jgi:hypothetical protein